ncbi:MAG: hypothetical protein CL784_02530 [Chloroflexi bacterium]|nr:hypothetical protein [Chloroflexota bacterium]|tara:strand:+ start:266 stop:490 length:225 start_codon:yes stop_codon:yes gene_type:complete
MGQLLESSAMLLVLAGAVLAAIGIVVLIATEESWILYAIGWSVTAVGAFLLFWIALRDRLRDRKSEDLDDVGFN